VGVDLVWFDVNASSVHWCVRAVLSIVIRTIVLQTDESVGSIGLRLPSPERLQRQGGVHHLEQLASASSQSAAIPVSTCTVRCIVINVCGLFPDKTPAVCVSFYQMHFC